MKKFRFIGSWAYLAEPGFQLFPMQNVVGDHVFLGTMRDHNPQKELLSGWVHRASMKRWGVPFSPGHLEGIGFSWHKSLTPAQLRLMQNLHQHKSPPQRGVLGGEWWGWDGARRYLHLFQTPFSSVMWPMTQYSKQSPTITCWLRQE